MSKKIDQNDDDMLASLHANLREQQEKIKILEEKLGKKTAGSFDNLSSIPHPPAPDNFKNIPVPPVPAPAFNYPPAPPLRPEKEFHAKDKNKDGEISFEEVLAGKWFTVIGVIVLVIGIGFFLGFAFKNNWISETVRIVMGVLAGVALLAVAERTFRKYFLFAQVVAGGGVSIFFLSVYYSYNVYHQIPHWAAFFSMFLITVVGTVISLRHNASQLMIMMVAGGFLTPVLAATGNNNQIALFAYIMIIDLGILVVPFYKKWQHLNLVGALGTAFIFIRWMSMWYTPDQLFSTLVFLTIFFVIYSIATLVYGLVKKESSTEVEQLLTMLIAGLYFFVGYNLIEQRHDDWTGLFSAGLSLYYILLTCVVRWLTPKDNKLFNFLAILSAGFLTIAIFLQFDKDIITIALTIEALLLIYLGLSSRQKLIEHIGLAIGGFAVLKLLFVDSVARLNDYKLIFNKTFLLYVIVISALFLTAYLYKVLNNDEERKIWFKKVAVFCLIMGNILSMIGGMREINAYHDYRIAALQKERSLCNNRNYYLNNRAVVTNSQQNNCSSEKYQSIDVEIDNVNNRTSVAVSLFWIAYSIILLIVGFGRNNKNIRLWGLGLLVLSLLKLSIYDLWGLGQLYRIVVFIVLGLVLIAVSFAYQKYKDKIKEMM